VQALIKQFEAHRAWAPKNEPQYQIMPQHKVHRHLDRTAPAVGSIPTAFCLYATLTQTR
jgi:hypothetical protein